MITWVGAPTEDGKFYSVAQVILKPVSTPWKPNGLEIDGWLYEVATGRVIWVPCSPPF